MWIWKTTLNKKLYLSKSIPTSPDSASASCSLSSVISSKSRMNHQSSSSTTIVTNFKQTLIDSILILEYHELNIEYWILWIRQWWKSYSETEIDATKQERSLRTWEQMQRLQTEELWIKRKKVGMSVITLNCWYESPRTGAAIQQFPGSWSHPVIINVMTPWLT